MRVLVLSDLFPPYGAGAEISTQLESINLANEGVEVTVITGLFNRDLSHESLSSNLSVFRIPLISQEVNESYPFATYLRHRFAEMDTKKMVPLIKKINPDIIHIQNSELNSHIMKQQFWNCKIVTSVRDNWPFCPSRHAFNGKNMCINCTVNGMLKCTITNGFYERMKTFGNPFHSLRQSIYYLSLILPHTYLLQQVRKHKQKCLTENADKIVAVSQYIKSSLMITFGFESSKINVVYPPISEFGPVPAAVDNVKTFFVFIGTLDYPKGIVKLIEAFYLALKKNKNIHLFVYGDGPLKQYVLNMANSRAMHGSLEYKGPFKHSDFEKVVKTGQVIIVPSLWPEPFGRVCAEAMLCGKPVIVNPVGGLTEQLKDNETGFFANCFNTSSLANKINDIANMSKEELNGIGAKARLYALEKFASSINTKSLMETYDELI